MPCPFSRVFHRAQTIYGVNGTVSTNNWQRYSSSKRIWLTLYSRGINNTMRLMFILVAAIILDLTKSVIVNVHGSIIAQLTNSESSFRILYGTSGLTIWTDHSFTVMLWTDQMFTAIQSIYWQNLTLNIERILNRSKVHSDAVNRSNVHSEARNRSNIRGDAVNRSKVHGDSLHRSVCAVRCFEN